MSVLLEALKKAAEEKKRQSLERGNPPSGQETAVESKDFASNAAVAERSTVPESSSVSESGALNASTVDLKFNFETTQSPSKDLSDVLTQKNNPEKEQTDSKLNFVHNEDGANHNDESVKKLKVDESLSLSRDVAKSVSIIKEEKSTHQMSLQNNNESALSGLKLKEMTKDEPRDVIDLESHLTQNDTADSQSQKNLTPQTDLKKTDEQQLAPPLSDQETEESELSIQSMSTHEQAFLDKQEDSVDSEALDTMLDARASGVQNLDAENLDSDDQHDWSLDQIPGYQADSQTQKQQDQARSLLAQISSKPAVSTSSRWRLYSVLGVLSLTAFSYYGLVYYEEQSSLMETELNRYQLRTHNIVDKRQMESNVQTEKAKIPVSLKTDAKTTLSKQSAEENIKESDKKEGHTLAMESSLVSKEPLRKTVVSNGVNSDNPNHKSITKPNTKRTTKSKALLKNNQQAVAKNWLPKTLKIDSKPQESKLTLAYRAYQAGNLNQAAEDYQQALLETPNNPSVLMGLGAIAVKQGEKLKALAYYQKVLTKYPNNFAATKAVLSIESTQQDKNVLKKLKALASKHPKDEQVLFALGNAYAVNGDWLQAQTMYFKAYEQNNHRAIYALNLAVSYDQLGQYRLARQYYLEALVKQKNANDHSINPQKIKARLSSLDLFLSKEH